MIRALIFFLQVAVLIGLGVWMAQFQGDVTIPWLDYTLTVSAGILIVLLVAVIFIGLKLISVIASLPGRITGHRAESRRRKGYRVLTRGLVAVAAGDAKKASEHARQARALLPDDGGLPVLLEAQAARLRGEEGEARRSFQKLLSDKDASFFGIRGLLKSALDQNDAAEALRLARQAQSQYPKQGWIIRTVYDLELKQHLWREAEETLMRLRKNRNIDKEAAAFDRVALLLAQAQADRDQGESKLARKKLERAVKLGPSFVPAVTALAEDYMAAGKNKKAVALIEKAWPSAPHPDLVALWDRLAPTPKDSDMTRRLRWYERLVALKPDSYEGQMAAGRAAMQDGLWGEARAYFAIAEKLRPTPALYRLRAQLEERTTQDRAAITEWLEKASEAPPPPAWICQVTGQRYERWAPVVMPQNLFNTLRWDDRRIARAGDLRLGDMPDALLLDHVA